jgi:hypothetical protein
VLRPLVAVSEDDVVVGTGINIEIIVIIEDIYKMLVLLSRISRVSIYLGYRQLLFSLFSVSFLILATSKTEEERY